jgi:hypothetical protein
MISRHHIYGPASTDRHAVNAQNVAYRVMKVFVLDQELECEGNYGFHAI